MAAPPPSYGREDMLMQQFRSIAQRYEISDEYARKLKQLEGWEIVLILDDSGSMNTPISNGQPSGPFARSITRWDELKTTAGIIVDIGAVMDKDGLDLYFLNRATVLNVTSSQQVEPLFQQPPNGLTPITPVLQHVLEAKKQIAVEKKILIVIATDGVPTNQQGHSDIPGLKNVLIHQRDASRFYVTFLACTDDEAVMAYLNEMDKKIPNLDVVDDYQSERREILKARGSKYPFSFGDYIVKTLLGSIDPTFDRLDEPKGCCSLQ